MPRIPDRTPARRLLLILTACAAALVVDTPLLSANATAPPGAQTELVLRINDVAVSAGRWADDRPRAQGGATPAAFGCAAGAKVAYAFAQSSSTPGAAGSPERPVVAAGQTALDVFDAEPLNGQPSSFGAPDFVPPYLAQVESRTQWNAARTNASPGATSTRLWQAFPTDARISLVAFCYVQKVNVPLANGRTQSDYVPAVDATGHAITSWIQFTTVADPNDATLTSAGFAEVGPGPTPTVTLSGANSGGDAALKAVVSDLHGGKLTGASGAIQFSTFDAGKLTPVGGPAPIDASTGTATLAVTGLAVGSRTTYVATFQPDSASAYGTADSNRWAAVVPGGEVAPPPSGAATGADWGPSGQISSPSAVTLRWDNVGNPAASIVERNQLQQLPYTDKKNYFDIAPQVLDSYESHFGAGDGYGGLAVRVSQTDHLTNQAITVDITGVNPEAPVGAAAPRAYFQIFQCWGAPDAQGRPDLQATSPDPSTCQMGAQGPDGTNGYDVWRTVSPSGDALTLPSATAPYVGARVIPFRSIDGAVESTSSIHKAFDHTSTNEWSHASVTAGGTATRQFEMQTSIESPALGCGQRQQSASTATCWLVIVPRVDAVYGSVGPISPSVWAQRIQVPLHFDPIAPACENGKTASPTGGSELLTRATTSWVPGICGAIGQRLGYSRYPDAVARDQYVAGQSDAVLTTQPLPEGNEANYTLTALTAPVIGMTIDYQPSCSGGTVRIENVANDADARACGYADLKSLKTDLAKAGTLVRDLRLTPRLVAKLLTQSYQYSVRTGSFDTKTQWWAKSRPYTLFHDPEFLAANPQLHGQTFGGDWSDASKLLVQSMSSDAASRVWSWLLADPAASAFINGCPDERGMTVNPFYSSRTYKGCDYLGAHLEQIAAAQRADTPKPANYQDQAPAYPPVGSPFPLPNWLEDNPNHNPIAMTVADWLPRNDFMSATARDTFLGGKPPRDQWCSILQDPTCQPDPGKYVSADRRPFGMRVALTITDAPSAAQYGLPTAKLCTDDGVTCVGADTASLRAAASRFVPSATAGVLEPGPDATAQGAYPLTMPVYAAIRPSLDAATRARYADILTFVVNRGQTPGFAPGDLPPGYAPLTDALKTQANQSIAVLRGGPASSSSAGPDQPANGGSGGGGTGSNPAGSSGGSAAAPVATEITTTAAKSPTTADLVTLGTGSESWPALVAALVIGLAAIAGAIAGVLRRRYRWSLGGAK